MEATFPFVNFLVGFWSPIKDFLITYVWYLVVIVAAFSYWTIKFRRWAIEAESRPTLAPIITKGGKAAELGSEAGMIVSAHLNSIAETYQRIKDIGGTRFVREAVGRELQEIVNLMETYTHLDLAKERGKEQEHLIKEELVITAGGYQIPVGALVNLFLTLFKLIWIPYRKRYENALIRLTLISSGDQTQLLVYRQRRTIPQVNEGAASKGNKAESARAVLTRTVETKNLSDLSNLLRDAAFMILQVHSEKHSGMRWLRRRRFVDGLDHVDEYLRTGDQEAMDRAKQNFQLAVDVGPDRDNYEVLYVHGSLLMLERQPETIQMAITEFKRALELIEKDNNDKVRVSRIEALIHSGLAFCHAQQIHRLAKSKEEVKKLAEYHADEAVRIWQEMVGEPIQPLILSRRFLARVVDEGPPEPALRATVAKRYLEATPDIINAIEQQPGNWTFYNMLGWLLMKVTEWDLDVEMKQLDEVPGDNLAKAAEWCLKRASELNPSNKLSPANLCLLYSAPYFREGRTTGKDGEKEKEKTKYRNWCRYYGKKALVLDQKYVNGHRDLAIGLIRYGDHQIGGEAHKYFIKAMELADAPEKDYELISDIQQTLAECSVSKKLREEWARPDIRVFDPKSPPSAGEDKSDSGSEAENDSKPNKAGKSAKALKAEKE